MFYIYLPDYDCSAGDRERLSKIAGDLNNPQIMRSSLVHDNHIFVNKGRCYSAGTMKQVEERNSPYWNFVKRFNKEVCSKLDELRECIENHVIVCDYRKLKYNFKTKTSYYYDAAISGKPEKVFYRGDQAIN